MKRCFGLLSLAFLLASCGGPSSVSSENESSSPSSESSYSEEVVPGEVTVSSLRTLENGKTIVEVDGKPFASIGVQIRADALMNCDGLSVEQLEPFFAKAGELGANTVEVPVEWKDIEPEQDRFDDSFVDAILTYANRYGVKVELLWFGTNMCGDTHSYSVPEYILCDGKTYPKLDADRTGEFWNYYGIQWFLDFSNENLIARESNAITHMMNHVYAFDRKNGETHPVVAVQILNEADIFARFRVLTKHVISPVTLETMTEEEAFEKILPAYDAYGKAVHASQYKVYTRANLASSTGSDNYGYYGISSDGSFSKDSIKLPPDWAKEIYELEGIDAVGDDTYSKKVKEIKGVSYMYGKNLPGNFSHIAENAGDYSNLGSLMIAALSQGAGYNIYDLATPPFYIAHATSLTVDQGICHYEKGTLTNRAHFEEVQTVIQGIKDAGESPLLCDSEDFLGLNTTATNPKQSANLTYRTTDVSVNLETECGAYGFACSKDGHLDLFLTDDATITLGNATVTSIQKGVYQADGAFAGETVSATSSFPVEGKKVYRVEYVSDGPLTSSAWSSIGGNEE